MDKKSYKLDLPYPVKDDWSVERSIEERERIWRRIEEVTGKPRELLALEYGTISQQEILEAFEGERNNA